ncbi:MAG: TRAP transporter small permease [Desulfitobacteriaceae bacterium]
MDKLAGICIFSVMLLIVTNIILRVVFNHPILGTYELVGFLTAMGIGFALAHCAFQDGHIAVSFIMELFPQKIQSIVDILINAVSLMFWAGAVWYLGEFGQAMKMKGLVSPSAEIPVYPFIYLIALGLLGLSMVVLFKFLLSCREVFGCLSLSKQSWELKASDTVSKVEI